MSPEWSHRLYQLLLYAYPAAFRREYGREMAQLFRDICPVSYTHLTLPTTPYV